MEDRVQPGKEGWLLILPIVKTSFRKKIKPQWENGLLSRKPNHIPNFSDVTCAGLQGKICLGG